MVNRPPDDDTSFPSSYPFSNLTGRTVPISTQSEDHIKETVAYGFGEPKTRVYRGPEEPQNVADILAHNPMDDPFVGCVVVIGGPGCGASLKLGYGRNSMGRDAAERVRLNFGDDQISRSGHAILTYDPRGRSFYLQSGTGANMTYIERAEGKVEPVLTPIVLHGGEVVMIGRTKLQFMPFCGPHFDWHAPPTP